MHKTLGTHKSALLTLMLLAGLSTLFSPAVAARDTEKALQQMFGDGPAYKAFFNAFQQAAQRRDVSAMLALIEYPLSIDEGKPRLLSAEQTALSFDRIFDARRLQLIVEQNFDHLHISNAGAAFGQGEIWFGGVCGENNCEQMQIRILRIGKENLISKRERRE